MTNRFASPVVILGARSDIGRAIAHQYAASGCSIVLAARDSNRLAADQADLETRYRVAVRVAEFDLHKTEPDRFFQELGEAPGTVVMVAGLLGDQRSSESDDRAACLVMASNYAGPARFLLAAARCMEPVRRGCIIGISSVAGDRGRRSNYVYGSAKAGFTAFLSGLRARLAEKNIQVITVKPGFVATRMTAGMKLPRLLTTSPSAVAKAVLKAHSKRSNVVYVSRVWRLIMLIIRLLPESIFKRLSI
jgi:decaprenylphospho-beta-D-erythro-pentofuranosid-2-ulose 2-reductase